MNKKVDLVKILGITATVMGMASTALSGWVNDKNMEKTISEKVAEEMAKQIKNL